MLTTSAEVLLGVDHPRFDVSDRQRAIWRVLDRLPTPRRSSIVENLRLMQVYETISSFGFDIALEKRASSADSATSRKASCARPTRACDR